MATITKALLRDRVLAYLGVIAVGGTASAGDASLTEETIDASFAGLACAMTFTFTLDAIPEWAQIPLRDCVGGALARTYGKTGDDLAAYRQAAIDAVSDLEARIPGAA